MSNIFNLFGSIEQKASGQTKIDSLQRQEIHQAPMKPIGIQQSLTNNKLQSSNATGKKQKGLSIRSKVDPNICTPVSSVVVNKNIDTITPKTLKKEESTKVSTPLSKKTLSKLQRRQSEKESKSESSVPVLKIPDNSLCQRQSEKGIKSEISQPVLNIQQDLQPTQKSDDTSVFKKPFPPKIKDGYPEPEKLSNDWTEENNFYYPRFENIKLDTPFIIPYSDDEDLDSDPIVRPRNTPSPCVNVSFSFDKSVFDFEEPDFPSVSD